MGEKDIATLINDIILNTAILRDKGIELGITIEVDDLQAIAEKFDLELVNRGSVNAQVKEGESYTIPKGWHNGGGVVAGVAGGGSYTLQAKSVTPTKAQQAITSDEGYYGLSEVTVDPIPNVYQDVQSVSASAGDVLANKIIVNTTGAVTGTMPNNGSIAATINALNTTEYTIPAGYHTGLGKVTITDDLQNALANI